MQDPRQNSAVHRVPPTIAMPCRTLDVPEAASLECTCEVQKGRSAVVPKKTTGTTWIIPENALQMFRATCLDTGRFEMARGGRPDFNPETASYVTSDHVTNVAAAHGIQILGDVMSARRFTRETHAWKEVMTLDQLIAHPYLGKTMPTRETIVAAYADIELIEA